MLSVRNPSSPAPRWFYFMKTIINPEELGNRLRKQRVDRRMTLKQVEEVCGLSATHLSEIERGRTSPTIGALVRIARALRRDPSFFLEREERDDVANVLREAMRPSSPARGIVVEALTPGIPGSEMFAYRVRIEAGKAAFDLPSDPVEGDAVYYVQSGALTITVGDRAVRLSTGDALQAALEQPHRLRADEHDPAELYVISTHAIEVAR